MHGPMGSRCPHDVFNCASCGRPGRCDGPENLHPGQLELWDVDGLGICMGRMTKRTCLGHMLARGCEPWTRGVVRHGVKGMVVLKVI